MRDYSKNKLGLDTIIDNVVAGTSQLTTFNQLGFSGICDKPDGWYLPNNYDDTAIIIECKNSNIDIFDDSKKNSPFNELVKNINIVKSKYNRIIGLLYNGYDLRVLAYNNYDLDEIIELSNKLSKKLENYQYYIKLLENNNPIDKELIYTLTARINNILHFDFGMKNLYQRMIFTSCALVAETFGANLQSVKNSKFDVVQSLIISILSSQLGADRSQKFNILLDELASINGNNISSQTSMEKISFI